TKPPEPTALPEPTVTPELAAEVALDLVGQEESLAFTLEELKALPMAEGQAGTKSSTGKITPPIDYQGVLLTDLLAEVGGLTEDLGVNIVAEDGYMMTFSYNQLTLGDFITYDPATGAEKRVEGPLQVLVAYARGGELLDPKGDGVLRLAIISPKNDQVTDGHWSVKWVRKIELKPVGDEWNLAMKGAVEGAIDRNSFQSCSAPGCHQVNWTDGENQVWTGVPLWTLVGWADDLIQHSGPAYFDALADAGYTIEIIAADGYSINLDSVRVKRNNELLVAYQVNGAPLPDKYFPLRLVGAGVSDNAESIGAISEIDLIIDPAVAASVPPLLPVGEAVMAALAEPAIAGDLNIGGLVNNPLGLMEEDLRGVSPVKITVEHPKQGPTEYEGVYLNLLLTLAGVQGGGTQLVLTAGDGYTTTIDLLQARACTDCLVAFTEAAGELTLVMPGFDSSAWVKDITHIEVK
ncbi:MAG TPA: molybdopterin-dependent oxidoreductase, partial [Anaerolineales bacterium]|nr:molybdopterin-dependent oxidoreductase [Anaerolineales bacterium]